MPDAPIDINWIMKKALVEALPAGISFSQRWQSDIVKAQRAALLAAGYSIQLDPSQLLERGKEDVPSGRVK